MHCVALRCVALHCIALHCIALFLPLSLHELIFFTSAYSYFRIPSTSPEQAKASKASVTTLSNGLTIVSEDASSTTTVSLTYPKAGSSNESVSEAGAALANKCIAFKSASGLSSALILRNLEDDGAYTFCNADRSSAIIGFTSAPDKAVRLVPLLATNCDYEKWDVRDALAAASMEVEEATSNAQVCFYIILLCSWSLL
jgi:hypothetical protein